MATPNTPDIRRFLTEAFSDAELTTLCFDYFRDVYEDFAAGMSKRDKIQRLIEHCDRRSAMSNLLVALRKERTARYDAELRLFAATPEPLPEPLSVKRDPTMVFLSHAHQDADFAHQLATNLQARGWRVWIAPDSIRPGEKWIEAINRGLEESGVFALLLTPAAVKSQWVRDETNIAIELQHQGSLRFIPAEIKTCVLPPFWRLYQRVRFTAGYEDGFAALLDALRDPTEEIPLPVPAAKPAAAGGPGEQPPPDRPVTPAAVGRIVVPQPDSTPRLRANLAHADPEIRLQTVCELGRLAVADDATIAALLRFYPADPADAPRHAALEALLALGRAADVGMVFVPAGEFLMGSGSADDDRAAESDERPQHKVYLPAYTLDRTPVTNAQYRRFIEAGGYGNPAYWKEAIAAGRWKDENYIEHEAHGGKPRNQPAYWNDLEWNGDQQPVVGVTWYEALAYLHWAGKRLPTEAEWEKAAAWTGVRDQEADGRNQGRKLRYPWGDAWDAKRCNTKESGLQKTTPVGNYQ